MEHSKSGSQVSFVALHEVTTSEHREDESLYLFWDIKIKKLY